MFYYYTYVSPNYPNDLNIGDFTSAFKIYKELYHIDPKHIYINSVYNKETHLKLIDTVKSLYSDVVLHIGERSYNPSSWELLIADPLSIVDTYNKQREYIPILNIIEETGGAIPSRLKILCTNSGLSVDNLMIQKAIQYGKDSGVKKFLTGAFAYCSSCRKHISITKEGVYRIHTKYV